ncbi:MAG: [Fe-Fe] hydrogenase large subunit C-terminal domain-containing protein [Phycisphaerae bacterium]
MKGSENIPLVTTIKERCRVCYTCVRECPAKAIRIADGQAEVITERCIGCGNCVRVCSQHAKQVYNSIATVEALLGSHKKVAACLAPSFPAEFVGVDPQAVVAMLRELGFDYVNEVAFGADLVARRYAKLLNDSGDGERYIATSCPAIVAYVEKYHPELTDQLAPIVSPMVAAARAIKREYGKDIRVVFIGPCIAKKGEAASKLLPDELSAALTFDELQRMLRIRAIDPKDVEPSDFDEPHAGIGSVFAISRGLLQAANLTEDLITGDVVAADGRTSFTEVIKEFETDECNARLLEVLCCNGCIMGAGMTAQTSAFRRRREVSRYARSRVQDETPEQYEARMAEFDDLNLSRKYNPDDQRIPVPFEEEIRLIMARMGKERPEDELNCGACGYETCRDHATAIFKGLAESEMCLPHTIEQLNTTVDELAISNEQLANAQEALVQSEKLASMGQLAAGIAHEVNNPLGVVLMYAHLLLEEAPEKSSHHEDLKMIAEQADRCKKIVAGLLDFARQNKVVHQPTDLRGLVDQVVTAYPAPENIDVDVVSESGSAVAEVDRDQILQVLANLVTNAYAAMPDGGRLDVKVAGDDESVQVAVADTGWGIPDENMKKIFEPFFTTKQIGKGTGLGLAVTYGIVKMHRGDITVDTNADASKGPTGTTFTVRLPRKGRMD